MGGVLHLQGNATVRQIETIHSIIIVICVVLAWVAEKIKL